MKWLMLSAAMWSLLVPLMAQTPRGIPVVKESARQQVRELAQLKKSLTPAQQKVGLAIYAALRASRGQAFTPSNPRMDRVIQRVGTDRADGQVLVDIRGVVSPDLSAAIRRAGGTVIHASVMGQSVRARLPLRAIEGIAARTDVRRVRPASRAMNRSMPSLLVRDLSSLASLNWFRLGANLAFPIPRTGLLATQGVISHDARQVHTKYGVQGAGVKVGVLSDSVDFLNPLIGTGDIGSDAVVLPGQDGGFGSSEGTAMMEIIRDVAPRAQQFFATGFSGEDSFADNIRALRDAGCSIIVDDIGYFLEGVFQDDIIARAVNDVTASGVLYLSAAGNDGNLASGTSGTWQGDAQSLGDVFGDGSWDAAHLNILVNPGTAITLQWADPLGGSGNDYDLLIFDPTFTELIDWSLDTQDGDDDGKELAGFGLPPGSIIVPARWIADGAIPDLRAIHVSTLGGNLQFATSGATFGHAAAKNAVGVAAVNWNAARRGTRPFVGGPTNPVEIFSSDGPRRIFFQPNGTPITPGNFLFATNGGEVVRKPDLAAADGTSSVTPGFSPFFGTSAAAPHAAAIAALIQSAKPSLTRDQILTIMKTSTLDIMGAGWDWTSGDGIVMAVPAVEKARQ